MPKVENEVVKEPTASGSSQANPQSKYYSGPTMLNFRDQTRMGVFTVVLSLTLSFLAVAIALLRFGPFAKSLLAIVSCSVMERGAVRG